MGIEARLASRTALISGAGGPMGAAIAMRLASEGATLVLTDISGNRLNGTVDRLNAQWPGAVLLAQRASVLVEAEVAALVESAHAGGARIDILVNVVGGVRGGALAVPVMDMTEERWNDAWEFNLKGTFHLVRALAGAMRERGHGRIVNISSVTYAGDRYQPEYGAAKAAVASITRSLALELAPQVTVNCIAPGMIATSVLERAPAELTEYYLSRTPLGRLGKPEDIAAAVAFLASDDAAFMTGAILPVTGGIWPAL